MTVNKIPCCISDFSFNSKNVDDTSLLTGERGDTILSHVL